MSRATPITALIDQSKLDDVVRELLMGLTTDGGHHKQYYLDKALNALVTDDYYAQAFSEFGWDKGIPS
jgi:hypothetical protein